MKGRLILKFIIQECNRSVECIHLAKGRMNLCAMKYFLHTRIIFMLSSFSMSSSSLRS